MVEPDGVWYSAALELTGLRLLSALGTAARCVQHEIGEDYSVNAGGLRELLGRASCEDNVKAGGFAGAAV